MKQPDWNQLWAFGVALLLLMLFAVFLWMFWNKDHKSFWQPMSYLGPTWSFKDSWVSNVIVGGSLLTGVLGSSSVVKAFLGENADSAIALATVGAAISVTLVGAGGIVVLAAKTRAGSFTVGGVLLAAATTLGGALGELWVVYQSARHLPLGRLVSGLPAIMLLAMALLLIYAARSLLTLLDQGTIPPPPTDMLKPPLSETIFAASMIVAALDSGGVAADTEAAIDRLRRANTQAYLSALKARPDVDGDKVELVLADLQHAKPTLERSEALLGIGNLVAGHSPRFGVQQAQATLQGFDGEYVSSAIDSLSDVSRGINQSRATAAIGEILSDEPIVVEPAASAGPPRAALL